jgi:hypothetical protein
MVGKDQEKDQVKHIGAGVNDDTLRNEAKLLVG